MLGILAASLLGSAHCAAMCGGFVCVYSGSEAAQDRRMLQSHALYNLGRLTAYALLGAIAGTLGAGVTRVGAMAGVSHAAGIVAGTLMIGWAITTIASQRGVSLLAPRAPESLQRALGAVLGRVRGASVRMRAVVMGLATGLIPCGWLYVFVTAAGASGRALDGAMIMAVFWIGTVPALVAVGLGAQRVFGPFRQRLPLISALTVLIIGLLTISGRLSMSAGMMHAH